MYARLQSEKALTPQKSDSPSRFKSLKHRLFDEDEEDANPSPPPAKRHKQGHYSIAPLFDKYKGRAVDEDDQPSNRHHGRRRHLSPSPDPEPPLVKELDDRYTHLRATLHSAALSSLSTAESELVTASDSTIRANRQNLAALESQLKSLVAPLLDSTVDYMATGEDGLPRTVAVSIRDAIAAFEETLDKTATELGGLWEEWEGAQEEIEGIAKELRGSVAEGKGKGSVSQTDASASHSEAVAGFGADLDQASKDVVEEMAIYEKKFLEEIEKEAGNIMHSFLNR
ncbi:hypothetical protein F4805DRAFT_471967 [Annulohypoxylon moriforme]|nr:hypothetical protein F4805DRAFT_471967 [Annulohypoxylon moriforme]